MKRRLILGLVTALVLFASQAQAGPLSAATWNGTIQGVPFTLVIGSGTVPGLPNSLLGLVASGSANGVNANVSVSVIPFTTLVTVPPSPAALALTISQMLGGNQVINVAGNGATATGTPNMGAPGLVSVFLNVGYPLLLAAIPLNVGGTGVQVASSLNPLVTHVSVTATFLGWQIDPFTVTGLTNQGVALPDAMFTGTNMLVGGVGTVTLVAPARVEICAGGGTNTPGTCTGASQFGRRRTATATTLKLTFVVPEPGVLLLLGAGLAGLALVDRRRPR